MLTIRTWNVQTLWISGKLELLRQEMKRFRYYIIGILDVCWIGKAKTSNGGFILSEEDNTHLRGVGLLLSTKARKALVGYNSISSRIITARFNAAPFKITVVHAYVPLSACLDENIEAFYGTLEDALATIHRKDILIMLGDWNAKVGSDNIDWKRVMGGHRYSNRYEQEERLLEFAATYNSYIWNTRSKQKSQQKRTWASPDGVHKNMVDPILIEHRRNSSIINCRTFQSADICSDHSLVLCNIRLRLKKMYYKAHRSTSTDMNQLKNAITRKSYDNKLTAKMEKIEPVDDLDAHVRKTEDAIKETADITILVKRAVKKIWTSEETLELANGKRALKQTKDASKGKLQQYKNFCKQVKKAAGHDKEH